MYSSKLPQLVCAAALVSGGSYLLQATALADTQSVPPSKLGPVPKRDEQLYRLRKFTRDNPCDILIVGGGATGAGSAVDAATRGYRTVLVEREDFGSGTSSKSTKLVHGGVRYLEKAVFNLDYGQLKLVYEALHERKNMLENAPHLTSELPILMPCYKWWELPFYWSGLKAYDVIAGFKNIAWSKILTPSESMRRLPTLADTRDDGYSLKGSVLYYDGQFDDARYNVALATTAAAAGAVVLNYAEADGLIKDSAGQVIGLRVKDKQTGKHSDVFAKVVLNATGPFADGLRKISNAKNAPCLKASSGSHVTLPGFYGSGITGMIIPKTKDGRVVFMLPFLDHIIAGTTDNGCEVTDRPVPTKEDVAFILDAISSFLSIKVRPEDVLSSWCGIRPLAADPSRESESTANLVRDHVIFTDPDGLITISGGKWTTYRKMAEDAIDAAEASGQLEGSVGLGGGPAKCNTSDLRLIGGEAWKRNLNVEIAQQTSSYLGHDITLSSATASHLAQAYGDQAYKVLAIAGASPKGALAAPLVEGQPFIKAEVVYCCRYEYCARVEDFIARRTRLAFLDTESCAKAIPKVAELMAAELGWGGFKTRGEIKAAQEYLKTFQVV